MDQLSLGLDQENGQFDGMSHSGTLVVVRNIGPDACRISAVPAITFSDGKKALSVKLVGAGFDGPPGVPMGHGPVVLPIVIAAGAEVTSTLRWVSGDVYEPGVSVTPKTLVLNVGGATQEVSFGMQMWGDPKVGVVVDMTRFVTDPVWHGNK